MHLSQIKMARKCTDGGKGADTKLLRLIQTHQVQNILIVVTRRVGSHIGYDRFQIIEDCAGRVISDQVLNSSLTF